MKEIKEMYPSWGDDHGVRLGNVKISDLHEQLMELVLPYPQCSLQVQTTQCLPQHGKDVP